MTLLMQGAVMVAGGSHNPVYAGSIPVPATYIRKDVKMPRASVDPPLIGVFDAKDTLLYILAELWYTIDNPV